MGTRHRALPTVVLLVAFSFLATCQADDRVLSDGGLTRTACVVALKRFPAPDATWTQKHLWTPCPELCQNSSGHFATGQFPHPWDCSAFINCYNDDAWVGWCQTGLIFNENNLQCDWAKNVLVSCQKSWPSDFSEHDGGSTQSQWELLSTTPSPGASDQSQAAAVTCKDGIKLNDRESLGARPDLCTDTDGTGKYRAPDCRFYVKCVGVKAYVQRCPGGFIFDPKKRQCDWPNKNPACLKICQDAGNYENTGKRDLPKPIDADLRTQNLTCNESHCVPKAGCQPELCKQPRGQFAVAGNCSAFVNCWDSCAYPSVCPAEMVFTESKGMCDNSFSLPTTDPCYKTAFGGQQ